MAVTTLKVPYVDIAGQHRTMRDELMEAAGRVIDSGQFVLSQEVERFEQTFAKMVGVPYAAGLNSATDALILALKALDIGPGDEVITAPNSFIASASCVAHVGAKPVFADVRDDYNIDPAKIEKAITPRTKAIIPVHLTGRPADMGPIMEIARRKNLYVVEDAAQAVLATYKGRQVGSFGHFGCFSLHPLKTLNACGDGGVITTNDEKLHRKIMLLRNHGLSTRDTCDLWGYNSRLDALQAALLLVKLKYLPDWTERRRANAKVYQAGLSEIPGIRVPVDGPDEKGVYHTFVVQSERRDELRQFLERRGIGTAIHYPIPIHLQKAAAHLGHGPGSFPVAERQAVRIVSLPVYPELTRADLNAVINAIREFCGA
ncbi:MAG: DegT/DnrJ/EryC1/StrS family aminotransferase [Chloroflexi bacterium]|nr:DegT/DnrJ/EryC1/StrS family aminotransferase [Chloroflexota bacterium]